jgi:hypothetical protein
MLLPISLLIFITLARWFRVSALFQFPFGPALYAWVTLPQSPNWSLSWAMYLTPASMFCSGSVGSAAPRPRAVPGMSCIRPTAPAPLRALGSPPLSAFMVAAMRLMGTPYRSDAASIWGSHLPAPPHLAMGEAAAARPMSPTATDPLDSRSAAPWRSALSLRPCHWSGGSPKPTRRFFQYGLERLSRVIPLLVALTISPSPR